VPFGPHDLWRRRDERILDLIEQRRREVKARHTRAGAGGGDRHPPRVGPHVEDILIRAMPANSTRCPPKGVVKMAVGVKDAHISRWRILRSANGSGWFMLLPPYVEASCART
jgi:hypothetical protein